MFDFLSFEFMQRAVIGGTIIALIAPWIGSFLVVRRLSLLSDTLSHVSLFGIALGLLTGIHPLLSAFVCALGAVALVEYTRTKRSVYPESLLALLLAGSLSLAMILFSLSDTAYVSIFQYLFGSIVTITWSDIAIIGTTALITAAFLVRFYRQFFLISFDEDIAKSSGLNVTAYNALLLFLAAGVISFSLRIVGALLIGALAIIPVMTAVLYKTSFKKTILLAIGYAVISVWSGIYLSYTIDTQSGPTIVGISILLFVVTFLYKQLHRTHQR